MKFLKIASFFIVAVLAVGCYPEQDRSLDDYDIIGTNFDSDADFQSMNTFFLHDSIIIIYDTTNEKPDYPLSLSATVLSSIRTNLTDLGWTEMLPADTVGGEIPDVYMMSYVTTTKISGVNYYYGGGYWNPWYGGYYPGYYPGYPGYGASYYSYTTGTVLIDMLDLVNPDHENGLLNIIWTGGLNGVVGSTESGNVSRVEYSIDQAFKQSSYLKIN